MTPLNQDIPSFFRQENLFEKTLILTRNEYLKEPDTTDTNIYFVQEGSVRLFITHEAEEQNIRLGYAGNIVVALDSFLIEKPSPICIQALKKSCILVASKKSFLEVMNKSIQHLHLWNSML
ncbi:Crp/Fnr family transcriptional regulator, partial [Elizabethkingia meningoseptica]